MVPVWLVGTVFAFWFFQGKHLRMYLPVEVPATPLQVQTSRLTVAHLWDANCICSRFNSGHVQALIKRYRQQGVDFVIVPRLTPGEDLALVSEEIRSRFGDVRIEPGWYEKLSRYMPAAPAAAVFDQTGRASYIGPYSSDLYCSSGSEGFVEDVLNEMLSGKKRQQFITPIVSGCFCPTTRDHEQHKV